jgi:flavin reductase (DIM6/NTAB) family NADH-FMN oxidoreductase RutF
MTIQDLNNFSRFHRANLINSISGFKPASLIATCDKNGNTNLAIFSNIIHLGADPALVGFINRPREAAPHTLANIEATGSYTINHIQEGILEKAHQTSAKYAQDISEFDAVGLTPQYLPEITAPFVKESKVKYSLSLVEIIPIKHNNTFLIIGSIQHLLFPPEILSDDGFLDLVQAGSICSLGIDAYYKTSFLKRLPYAKPKP